MEYIERVAKILGTLNLPITLEGLKEAHSRTKARETLDIASEGYDEKINRGILPIVLKENPRLLSLLEESDEDFVSLCDDLDWFLERVRLLSGELPLPSEHGVHVKNFTGKKSQFGFLVWEAQGCTVKIKPSQGTYVWPPESGGEERFYPAAWDAAMDGWLPD
jgi:hypothetical protein